MRLRLLSILISFGILIGQTQSASALSPLDPLATDQMDLHVTDIVDGNFNLDTDGNSVNVIVGQVIKVFLGMLATIFIILMILSGYYWMTAAGEGSKVTKAQDTIRTSIIGLLITMAAYIITYFVFLAVPGSA